MFLLCKQQWVAHMAGAHALGFSAQEIDSACRLAGIPADLLTETATQARDMGRIAAEALNNRKP